MSDGATATKQQRKSDGFSLGDLPLIKSVRERWESLHSFRLTRDAIRGGTPLWHTDEDVLKAREYMKPWRFSEQAIELSSLPTTAALAVLGTYDFLTRVPSPSNVDPRAEAIAKGVIAFLFQFVVPLGTLAPMFLSSLVIGAGRKNGPEVRRILRCAFLYFEGAWFVLPWMAINALNVLRYCFEVYTPGAVGIVLGLAILPVSVVLSWRVLHDLYSSLPQQLWRVAHSADDYPGLSGARMALYRLITFGTGPVVAIATVFLAMKIGDLAATVALEVIRHFTVQT